VKVLPVPRSSKCLYQIGDNMSVPNNFFFIVMLPLVPHPVIFVVQAAVGIAATFYVGYEYRKVIKNLQQTLKTERDEKEVLIDTVNELRDTIDCDRTTQSSLTNDLHDVQWSMRDLLDTIEIIRQENKALYYATFNHVVIHLSELHSASCDVCDTCTK
jgi:hypothetical protein